MNNLPNYPVNVSGRQAGLLRGLCEEALGIYVLIPTKKALILCKTCAAGCGFSEIFNPTGS
jgi:adenine C2-methylase RlmN of 23S rRNA A2503 and tRNA A37